MHIFTHAYTNVRTQIPKYIHIQEGGDMDRPQPTKWKFPDYKLILSLEDNSTFKFDFTIIHVFLHVD